MLTQAKLKDILHYNSKTGVFTRIKNVGLKVKSGEIAGSYNTAGYRRIKINGTEHLAHRLAWLYVYGSFPLLSIDHINCTKDDNRILNLREATNSQNAMNKFLVKSNTSNFKGVTYHKSSRKWQAGFQIMGKFKYIGLFDTPEMASLAYQKHTKIAFGEFCNNQ